VIMTQQQNVNIIETHILMVGTYFLCNRFHDLKGMSLGFRF
jgi:hypothetical protein